MGSHSATRKVIASAPGKVNLLLRSGPPDSDGYHPLLTVFETVKLREWVEISDRADAHFTVRTLVYEPHPLGAIPPRFSPEMTAVLKTLPPEQHLAVRAAKLLAQRWGVTGGADITVHKTVPVAAGMAGGSADAAAVLVGAAELWGPQNPEWRSLSVTQRRDLLTSLGQRLGADVPACLLGGWSVGTGRGDQLSPIEIADFPHLHWWTLAFHEEQLSTPRVFAQFDRLSTAADPNWLRSEPDLTWSANRHLLPRKNGEEQLVFVNDLQPATLSLVPSIETIGEMASRAGACGWTVSGSGPTVAALSFSLSPARQLAEMWGKIPEVRAVTITTGPAEGAKIVDELPGFCVDSTDSETS